MASEAEVDKLRGELASAEQAKRDAEAELATAKDEIKELSSSGGIRGIQPATINQPPTRSATLRAALCSS